MTYLISQHSIPKLLKWTFIIFRILGTVFTYDHVLVHFRFGPDSWYWTPPNTFLDQKLDLSIIRWNDKRNQAKTFYTSMMIVHYFVQFVLMILLLPREKFNFIPQGILLNTQRKRNIWDSAVHLARRMTKMADVTKIATPWNVYMTMVSVMVLWAWTKYTNITIQWLLSIIYSTTSTSKYW